MRPSDGFVQAESFMLTGNILTSKILGSNFIFFVMRKLNIAEFSCFVSGCMAMDGLGIQEDQCTMQETL